MEDARSEREKLPYRLVTIGTPVPVADSAVWRTATIQKIEPLPAEPLKAQDGRISALRSYQSLREREKEERRSVEIQIQEELFPRFRAWCHEQVLRRYPGPTAKDLIYGGSMFLKKEYGHGSADTTREWLNELMDPIEGEFEPVEIEGHAYIGLKGANKRLQEDVEKGTGKQP